LLPEALDHVGADELGVSGVDLVSEFGEVLATEADLPRLLCLEAAWSIRGCQGRDVVLLHSGPAGPDA
jgi:hypothetical protein